MSKLRRLPVKSYIGHVLNAVGCSTGYGGYGGYNVVSGYGVGGGSEVARIAEDSTRSAFQSVEALVHAFSSISMMLESTYFALHSSFRAVIGKLSVEQMIQMLHGQNGRTM